jgi:hypothetical protein
VFGLLVQELDELFSKSISTLVLTEEHKELLFEDLFSTVDLDLFTAIELSFLQISNVQSCYGFSETLFIRSVHLTSCAA